MISFLQSKNLSFPSLEHGFLKKDQTLMPPPYCLKQIHSNTVLILEDLPEQILEADGMVTKKRHLALGIKTADCVPVLLFDPEALVIGALHAGWKGALAGICQNSLTAMESLGAQRSRILVALGPSISQESYEVDDKFKETFLAQSSQNSSLFFPSRRENHFLFDLKGYVVKTFQNEGVSNIDVLPFNTYTSPNLFHSYRRATHEGLTEKEEYNLHDKPNNISFIKLK